MKVTYELGRWLVYSEYREKDVVKGAGCRWDPKVYKWWTDRAEVAAKLREFCDAEAIDMIDRVLDGKRKAVAASQATNADIEVPVPQGLAYLPYQKAGIAYALKKFGDI